MSVCLPAWLWPTGHGRLSVPCRMPWLLTVDCRTDCLLSQDNISSNICEDAHVWRRKLGCACQIKDGWVWVPENIKISSRKHDTFLYTIPFLFLEGIAIPSYGHPLTMGYLCAHHTRLIRTSCYGSNGSNIVRQRLRTILAVFLHQGISIWVIYLFLLGGKKENHSTGCHGIKQTCYFEPNMVWLHWKWSTIYCGQGYKENVSLLP